VPVRASIYGGHLCVAVPHERNAALHDQPLTIALDPVTAITMRLQLPSERRRDAEVLQTCPRTGRTCPAGGGQARPRRGFSLDDSSPIELYVDHTVLVGAVGVTADHHMQQARCDRAATR
jgi:hypothetical protein